MNVIVDEISTIPPKPYVILKNITVTPDSLGVNIPFKLKATVYNFGIIPLNNITVKLTIDSITKLLSTDSILISNLAPETGYNVEWNLNITNPIESFGFYTIKASSPLASYNANGSFNVNITHYQTLIFQVSSCMITLLHQSL